MGKQRKDLIDLAIGPYNVNKANAWLISEEIWFRHYKADELKLAKEFIRRGELLGRWYFDVYLSNERTAQVLDMTGFGGISEATPWFDRIDATCESEEELYIIEFKDRLAYSGIGQLLGYKPQYIDQYSPELPVKLGYVYHIDKPELHELLSEYNIRAWMI